MDGVLCRYRIERRLALLASWSGQSPDAIHAAIWRSGFEDEAERGLVSADEYLKGFGERMGYPLSAAQWIEARRVAMDPDQTVLSLARQLSTHHLVGMFTNNPFLLKRYIAEVFPAVPRLGLRSDEILYFDDDAAYVAGAQEAGLAAHPVGEAADVSIGLAAHLGG